MKKGSVCGEPADRKLLLSPHGDCKENPGKEDRCKEDSGKEDLREEDSLKEVVERANLLARL